MGLCAVLEAVWRFSELHRMNFEMYLHTHLRGTYGATAPFSSAKKLHFGIFGYLCAKNRNLKIDFGFNRHSEVKLLDPPITTHYYSNLLV